MLRIKCINDWQELLYHIKKLESTLNLISSNPLWWIGEGLNWISGFFNFKRLNYLLNLALHKTRPLHFVFQSFVNISVVDIFKYLRCTVCKQLFDWIFQICRKLFFFKCMSFFSLHPGLSLASFSIFQLKSVGPKMKIYQRTRLATQAKSRLTINF